MALRNTLFAATVAVLASTAAFASDVPPSDSTSSTEAAAVPTTHKAAHKKTHAKKTHKKSTKTTTTSTDTTATPAQ